MFNTFLFYISNPKASEARESYIMQKGADHFIGLQRPFSRQANEGGEGAHRPPKRSATRFETQTLVG